MDLSGARNQPTACALDQELGDGGMAAETVGNG
jgi:hypothetical protein